MFYYNENTYHIHHPNDASVVVTLAKNYDLMTDKTEANWYAGQLLESLNRRIYWIVDFRNMVFEDNPSVVRLLELTIAFSSANASIWHHPNVRQVIFVTDHDVPKLMAEQLKREDFGYLNVRVCSKLADAFAYARSQSWETHITYQPGITSATVG
jgi:hypothetical protein